MLVSRGLAVKGLSAPSHLLLVSYRCQVVECEELSPLCIVGVHESKMLSFWLLAAQRGCFPHRHNVRGLCEVLACFVHRFVRGLSEVLVGLAL